MYHKFVGKRSEKVINWVERGAVRKFAEAIGDVRPIYFDPVYASKTRYGKCLAPPTFPRTFQYGQIEQLELPSSGLIHGEQIFHYKRPLFVGEEIHCYAEVESYSEKKGSSGNIGLLILKNVGEDPDGELIYTEKLVVIITEALLKEETDK